MKHQPSERALEVNGLLVEYGGEPVLDGISFSVKRGEIVSVVGPSGCGKTTLLRCIAGLLQPTHGSVQVDGDVVDGPHASLAVVLQEYSRSLLPWLTVRRNVALPLAAQRLERSARESRARNALEAVGLAECAHLYPWQLSGGMQQRVAIARGIAYEPEILLMDEPFASVDAQTRSDLEDLTLKIRKEFGMTIVVVTHDIDESVYLADRVVVLSRRPTIVSEVIDVPLGEHRDQVSTKESMLFSTTRGRVARLITRQKASSEAIESN